MEMRKDTRHMLLEEFRTLLNPWKGQGLSADAGRLVWLLTGERERQVGCAEG